MFCAYLTLLLILYKYSLLDETTVFGGRSSLIHLQITHSLNKDEKNMAPVQKKFHVHAQHRGVVSHTTWVWISASPLNCLCNLMFLNFSFLICETRIMRTSISVVSQWDSFQLSSYLTHSECSTKICSTKYHATYQPRNAFNINQRNQKWSHSLFLQWNYLNF